MVGYARPHKVTPSGLEEAHYQATLAARTRPLTAIPNPRSNYRMTLEAKLLGHIFRESGRWHMAQVERDGREEVAAALTAHIVARFPVADMNVLARYGLANRVSHVFVDVADRTGRRGDVRIPIAEVRAPMRGMSYVAILDGSLMPSAMRDCPEVPETTIAYFARVVEARDEHKSLIRETPSAWVARFKREIGRVPRWFEIEKAFPAIGAWLDMRRQQS